MSGKLKEVRTRIGSVKNTQQITKAMKVVSAAKLRKAQDAILRMRPYSVKMTEILGNLAAAVKEEVSIPQAEVRPIQKVLLVAVTSDRGLCGGFNSAVVKQIKALATGTYAQQAAAGQLYVMSIGKKAFEAFGRLPYPTENAHWELMGNLDYAGAKAVSDALKEAFANGAFDRIDVVYNSFKNAATQIMMVEQFLPIKPIEAEADKGDANIDFIFEPDRDTMVQELVPRILDTQFFRCLLDSNAAEHGARMTAMDQATDNAEELLKDLRISYNRARQASITTELTEIVSGAAALAEG